jgi:catechol 2,3-dioxygenase-like lactoylglutathione lyase family enzyme
MKTTDVERQTAFYDKVLGMGVEKQNEDLVFLMGARGEPFIVLTPGGEHVSAPEPDGDPLRQTPVWLSFETGDARALADDIKARDVTLLRDLTPHPDWGGLDFIIADRDGNPVQIVQQGAA